MREPAVSYSTVQYRTVPRVSICAYVLRTRPRGFSRDPLCVASHLDELFPFLQYHLYLDVLRVRPAVLWPAVLSRFRGDAPRYCRHSICPARSALYVRVL